jgi:hypothetical protein
MRRFTLLPILLLLSACDPASLTDTPTGTYVEEKDISETGDPEFLTKGCDTEGNPILAIDPALKVGTVVSQLTKLETMGVGIGELDITTQVSSVTATNIVQKYTVNKVSKYSGYTAGQNFNVSCSLQSGQADCTTDGPTETGTEHAKYEDCQFTAQPQIDGKLTKGKYSFKNGPTVTAFKLTLTGKGPIKCGNETFADALVEQNLLTSNEIPSTEFNYCGGSPITFFAKIASDGKSLKATFMERANAGNANIKIMSASNGPMIVPFERYCASEFIPVRPASLKFGQ